MKYHNKKTLFNGIEFDSKKEAQRYSELLLLQRAGEITELQRQKKFVLIPSQRMNGKVVERECSYYADFVYREKRSGNLVVEDTKGMPTRTKDYIIKRKLLLQIYGLRIKEV